MGRFFRKLFSFLGIFRRKKPESSGLMEEKWIADFGKARLTRFNIKSESAYDANCRKSEFGKEHHLVLGLKKFNCLAWLEVPELRYGDLMISGVIRIKAMGAYAAGGVHFRMLDESTYYSFLISNKDYFRLDAVRNGMPNPLIGWTELPPVKNGDNSLNGSIPFSIISYGTNIIITIRGQWAAEIEDGSISEGGICFSAASYEETDSSYTGDYTAEVFLEALTVESRFEMVSAEYRKMQALSEENPKARLNLAETFAAINRPEEALNEIHKCWNVLGHRKSSEELLLAGRLAYLLGYHADAEAYISECIQADPRGSDGMEALTEMAMILDQGQRFTELRDFTKEALTIKPDDPVLWNFLGHAFWGLKKKTDASRSYKKAHTLEKDNPVYAKNAAYIYDVMGKTKEALPLYLIASRSYLKNGMNDELTTLIPKLSSLGEKNWEARSLIGKWAFAMENYKKAKSEFTRAESLRKAMTPRPKEDGAQVFLCALLFIQAGKRKEALPYFRKAVSLEKDFALFHYRLAENLFLMEDNPADVKMLESLNSAIELVDKEDPQSELAAWIFSFSAQIQLRNNNLELAELHLERAKAILKDDPDGTLANCAGNIHFRKGNYADADANFRKAISENPENIDYLCNLASCHIEQGYFGEADELLARAHNVRPDPAVLEMIAYVSIKKGEYNRAEEACRAALQLDPKHSPSILSLGWILLNQGRFNEVGEVLKSLDALVKSKAVLKAEIIEGRDELRFRLEEMIYEPMECSSCGRSWQVLKDPPPSGTLRLRAMPPDNLPAGICPQCGKLYCIGCAKKKLDKAGRFICIPCKKSLKLNHEGLKHILWDWAEKKK